MVGRFSLQKLTTIVKEFFEKTFMHSLQVHKTKRRIHINQTNNFLDFSLFWSTKKERWTNNKKREFTSKTLIVSSSFIVKTFIVGSSFVVVSKKEMIATSSSFGIVKSSKINGHGILGSFHCWDSCHFGVATRVMLKNRNLQHDCATNKLTFESYPQQR